MGGRGLDRGSMGEAETMTNMRIELQAGQGWEARGWR